MPVAPASSRSTVPAQPSPTPKTPAEQLVAQAYQQNLGRAPDAGGLKTWSAQAQQLLAQGKPHAQVKEVIAEGLRNSDEWRGRMISVVYKDNLGRKPDPAGLKAWAAKAKWVAGAGSHSSEVQRFVTDGVRNSGEWRKRMIGGVFKSELGRPVDAAGLKHWVAQTNQFAAAGRPSDQIYFLTIGGVRASPEWQNKQVGDAYRKVLGRPADKAGLKHHAALFREYMSLGLNSDRAIGHVRALLQNSSEYRKKHPGAKVPAMPPSPADLRAFYAGLQQQSARVTKSETGYVNGRPQAFQIRQVTNGHWLRADAGDAFMRMFEKARRDGVHLDLNSGFRSMPEQQRLYRMYRNGTGNLAARPGYSNHQGGIAVDVTTNKSTNHPAYRWLAANAASFGFKRTVPSEPWHWEYRP